MEVPQARVMATTRVVTFTSSNAMHLKVGPLGSAFLVRPSTVCRVAIGPGPQSP